LATRCTTALCTQLQALGLDPINFAAEFDAWKAWGSTGEYQSYTFGKDGGYAAPAVGGVRYLLRHVHLVPLEDTTALRLWDIHWRRRSRKTSDRVLVYVSDHHYGHLLIFILEEPIAHEIAQMKTGDHKTTMRGLAKVAEQFIHDGTVIG